MIKITLSSRQLLCHTKSVYVLVMSQTTAQSIIMIMGSGNYDRSMWNVISKLFHIDFIHNRLCKKAYCYMLACDYAVNLTIINEW